MNTLKNHLTSAQDAIKTHANKALAATALLTTLTLGSCGHKAPSTEQSDSTKVQKTEVLEQQPNTQIDSTAKDKEFEEIMKQLEAEEKNSENQAERERLGFNNEAEYQEGITILNDIEKEIKTYLNAPTGFRDMPEGIQNAKEALANYKEALANYKEAYKVPDKKLIPEYYQISKIIKEYEAKQKK